MGVAGVALFAGYWMVHLAHVTGNPLFPYFNQYFHSPLALAASYRDVRFLPHDLFARIPLSAALHARLARGRRSRLHRYPRGRWPMWC